MTLDDDLVLARALADASGAAIRPFFRAPFVQETKADASPVTEADRAAEAAIRQLLAEHRPQDGIIGEEYGRERDEAERVWVLDPIDGTRAFIAGRPTFGTLIALMEQGRPVLGVVDQPIAGERWVGSHQGTSFNGMPVRTRGCRELAHASLATTSPHLFDGADEQSFLAAARAVSRGHLRQNIIYGGDCYNYGLLASGFLDLVIEAGLQLYDFAALVPVVEGAGGRMSDWSGAPLGGGSDGRVIAVGDPALLEPVLEALRSSRN
jgi:inositol-phosphate phosphatase / L-galactose 1-phosphate phosphatase / histidinol-phosphatase